MNKLKTVAVKAYLNFLTVLFAFSWVSMTHYIGEQMDGKLTRQDVLERIEYYKSTNKK